MKSSHRSLLTALLTLSPLAATAAPQNFGYTYNANTLAKGGFEFENRMTWENSPGTNAFEFEHELEYGITDQFQLSLLGEWTYERADGQSTGDFLKAGVEGIYQFTNPNSTPLGSAALLEAAVGPDEWSIESKILLQKNFGPVITAYNVGGEAVWEGDNYNEANGAFFQSLAVGYNPNQSITLGGEILHTMDLPDWSGTDASALFAGPSASFRFHGGWIAATGLWRLNNEDAAPDFQANVKIGFLF